ncbi:MAG: hypothetical protein KF768_09130 [Phycisphaeraceae bacterium]|nr:hypothetical protein [Phycisphaeraceae bacterium]
MGANQVGLSGVRVRAGCALGCAALLVAGASALMGCSSGSSSAADANSEGAEVRLVAERSIGSGVYSAEGGAFAVARETLRDNGYMLERVDAASGVITTRPKTTAGIVTPWHRDQSTFEQELSDFANRQQRTVRITFAPEGREHDELMPGDLRAHEGPVTMRVRVIVERMNRPGRRVDTTSVRMSSYFRDTELEARGFGWQYAVADEDDRALAERLAAEIVRRSGGAGGAGKGDNGGNVGSQG